MTGTGGVFGLVSATGGWPLSHWSTRRSAFSRYAFSAKRLTSRSRAAHPYYIFSPSCEIDFASPKGTFPVDPTSIELWAKDKECIDFLKDETVKAQVHRGKTLSDVDAAKYDGPSK
ncbi:hypothetical protein C8J56DRAFT_1131542 [Mycena floridula]|nr:hypothetical protein C8J56DRAFT_1131542 [Mycena floridula]